MVKTTKAYLQTDKELQPENLFLEKLEAQKTYEFIAAVVCLLLEASPP
ncbi:hypothetical protein [Coxiella-like endosymbiont]|nr:hypothetical protein [Coxiella-like endosymbiont]